MKSEVEDPNLNKHKFEIKKTIVHIILYIVLFVCYRFMIGFLGNSFEGDFFDFINKYEVPIELIFTIVTKILITMYLKLNKHIIDRNLKFLVKFRTTFGISAIIINKSQEVLLIKSTKDNEVFHKQPGCRYRIKDFTCDISNFEKPLSKILKTIEHETGIKSKDLSLLNFANDKCDKWRLDSKTDESLKEVLAEESNKLNINEKYRNNVLIPTPFLIEGQDGNNPNFKINTIDMFYAFEINDEGMKSISEQDNICFYNEEEINDLIIKDMSKNTLSLHHDLGIIIKNFYILLKKNKPKFKIANCIYEEYLSDLENVKKVYGYKMSKKVSKPCNKCDSREKCASTKHKEKVEYFQDITDFSAKEISEIYQKKIIILSGINSYTTLKNFLNHINNRKTHKTYIFETNGIYNISEDHDMGKWEFFKSKCHIDVLNIMCEYRNAGTFEPSVKEELKVFVESIRKYTKTINYVVDYKVLIQNHAHIINICKELQIKNMIVLCGENTKALLNLLDVIDKVQGSRGLFEDYYYLNNISYIVPGCKKEKCDNKVNFCYLDCYDLHSDFEKGNKKRTTSIKQGTENNDEQSEVQ